MHFDEKFWIAAAFLLFLALVYKKIFQIIVGKLDNKLAEIKSELSKAESLKEEATNLSKTFKKEEEIAKENAKRIIEEAKNSADNMLKSSKKEIENFSKKRLKEIDNNIDNLKHEHKENLRQEIVDTALSIVDSYLKENKEEIQNKSFSESLESLKAGIKN